MSVNLRIVDHQTWGRYLSIYTVFRIDVKYKDDNWFIFRRFSEFTDMHTAFLNNQNLAALAEPLTELLPPKEFFGSTLSTFESTCNERKQRFMLYLEALLQEKQLRKSPAFMTFLDVQNKGISGIKRVLGNAQIVREEFTMCSQGRLAKFGYNSWVRSYICLTKKGWIYCTKCIYDTPEECEVKMDLKSKYTRIGGLASDSVIHITYNDTIALHIKFRDVSDFSSWLRQLSDFGINTAEHSAMKETVVKAERRGSARNTHVHAAGTGNTEDDLSADYGI